MSKHHINTKSSHYLKDKEAFLKELRQFNESKNVPTKTPYVNGIELDLYLFYTLVQQKGGLSKVIQYDYWDSFLRPLRLPHPCINGTTLLRKFYSIYLEKYEKAKGPPSRDDDNDLDDDPRRSRSGIPRVSYAGAYITASGEQIRTAAPPKIGGPSERLALSLLSPMPNEQDFGINVCTVLAADQANRLLIGNTPHILDFLLAHAGVYNHTSLRDTIGRSYYEARGLYPHQFWEMRAGGGGAKELADETKFMQSELEQPELMVQALAAHNTLTDCLMQEGIPDDVLEKVMEEQQESLDDWVTEPSDEDQLFAPALPGGAGCVYTQRVMQVASIIRSLSFQEDNVQYLAKNNTLIRFLLLCSNCWVGTLRQSGLDTLGNISTELIIKDPATCLISRHILSTIQSALVSPDRARVLAALELLNKLAQNEANEDALLRSLEAKVYNDVCALLTMRDIMVLVCTLECVFAMTSLGSCAAEAVARAPGLVHTLVALVTVEAQSYGPKACILMRVVETVSGPSALAAVAEKQEQEKLQQQQQQQQQQQVQQPVQQQPQPQPPAPVAPPLPATRAPSPPQPPPAPAVSSLQQSHLQQRTSQENEQFALAWLRASFEPLPPQDNSTYNAAEMYRQYITWCQKLQKKGVAHTHFPRLVRTVFGGTVGPNPIAMPNGETQQAYVGIRARNPPPKLNTPAGPASPILKAQLTNKAAENKPVIQQTPTPVAPPVESAPNTSLIKHLLAHKVSPVHPQLQVAQRQQNQQRIVNPTTNVIVQPNQSTSMELDPEALIKCTTITPGGVASSTPAIHEKIIITAPDETMVPKEEPVQIQIDEQAQLTIKTTQNKMLADLLEKKSNPPVQVVQMTPQMNAPTIQITETGQIVQVKQDNNPVIQINSSGIITQSAPLFQIKNEQGQIIQLKNEQGQIIQLKADQLQTPLIQFKNEHGQIVQIKNEQQTLPGQPIIQGQSIIQGPSVIQGQSYQGQHIIQQPVIQTLKLEKEMIETVTTDHSYTEPMAKKMKLEEKEKEPQESVSKTAANLYAALAASALEDEEDLPRKRVRKYSSAEGMKLRKIRVTRVFPIRVTKNRIKILIPPKQEEVIQQPVIVSGGGDNTQVIIQEPILQVQQPTIQVQQPTMQMQGQTLQMQQSMIQVQPMDVQNILASQSGQIIIQEKPMVSQQQYVQQPMQLIAAPGTSQGGINYLAQNMAGNMMQKTIIIVQSPAGGTPITFTNPGVIQSTQRVIVSQPTLVTSQAINAVKNAIAQSTTQLTSSQQPVITNQPQPHKAQIMNQPQQIVVTQKQPPALISTSTNQQLTTNQQIIQGNQQMLQGNQQMLQGNQQIIQGNQQIIQGNQQLLQGNQQIIAVSNNQQVIVNSPMKNTTKKVIQTARSQANTVVSQPNVIDNKPSVIQSSKTTQPGVRQVITRQPVMVGNTKIGDKETVQTVTETKPAVPKPTSTPPPQAQATFQQDTPWMCHWRGCGKTFDSASEVFTHVARVHCPGGAGSEAACLWLDCDRVPRKTFALLNHLSDKHCSAQALKAVYNSGRHMTIEADANKSTPVGYPPNAALAALNKHATELFNPRELMDENEGPVTKSIRLTAALILRNIVIYSNTGRRQVRAYEAHLSSIALSSVEASRTIAQVLYDMNNI